MSQSPIKEPQPLEDLRKTHETVPCIRFFPLCLSFLTCEMGSSALVIVRANWDSVEKPLKLSGTATGCGMSAGPGFLACFWVPDAS